MTFPWFERYPMILVFQTDSQEIEKLNEEFLDYQGISRDEVPKEVWDSAACYKTGDSSEKVVFHRMDIIWSHLASI